MAELLTWLEGSALGETMRGLGVWSYGVFNLAHILGIASLFGSILLLDLRLIGVWRDAPLRVLAAPTVPLAACGFALAALSGICMISTNATEYLGNPFLYVKFPAIALGIANAGLLSASPAWKQVRAGDEPSPRERRQLAVAGGASLVFWLAAISSGRMIGYW